MHAAEPNTLLTRKPEKAPDAHAMAMVRPADSEIVCFHKNCKQNLPSICICAVAVSDGDTWRWNNYENHKIQVIKDCERVAAL
jgi:hypothetical protein